MLKRSIMRVEVEVKVKVKGLGCVDDGCCEVLIDFVA